jgi:hypothetical protein
MGVLLMLMTIGGVITAIGLVIASLITGKRWLRNFTLSAVGVWFVFYGLMLVGFSAASKEQTLQFNEPKEYCGFYLDCHVHTAVTGVRTSKSIGPEIPNGLFYIVNVKVFSDAKNPEITMRLLTPDASAVDESGNRYGRAYSAEKRLPSGDVDLGRDIHSYEAIEKEIVFDLPLNVSDPRLDIREGYGIDHVIEAVLVDDEDSIFHRRNYFDLKVSEPKG